MGVTMHADLVVFGPHPDDIEIGIGGSVATHVDLGCTVGLCDLTRGELGSNGTPEERVQEAQAVADVLGVAWRRNLGWPDGEIGQSGVYTSQIRSAAELIRNARPSVVVIPYWTDRHPDPEAASRVLREAVSTAYARKQAAFACYVSQFRPPGEDAVETRLTGGPFLHMIEARDAHLGTQIGAAQAEGFVVKDPLVRPTLLKS